LKARRREGERVEADVNTATRFDRRSLWYEVGMSTPFDRGVRGKKPIPGFVRTALAKHKVTDAFLARPEYQRNDYLTWLEGAKLTEQRQQRLDQLVTELQKGDVYMGEPWSPPSPRT
jgi:hypothetical protein